MPNFYRFLSKNYFLTKTFLVLGIVIFLLTFVLVGINYKNHTKARTLGFDQLLSTLENTYLSEMVKENERQLSILVSSLDKEKIRREESAFNLTWTTAHQVKMDREHHLYFYNAATGRIDGYPEWTAPSNFVASERPWYSLLSIPETAPRWVGPYEGFASNKQVLTLGQKVIAANGQVIGLMMVDMLIDNINRVLERMAPELDVSLFLRQKESHVMLSVVNESKLNWNAARLDQDGIWLDGLRHGALMTRELPYAEWELGIYVPQTWFQQALYNQLIVMLLPICAIALVTLLGIKSLLNIFEQELKIVEHKLKHLTHATEGLSAQPSPPSWFIDKSLSAIEQQYNAHHQLLRMDPLTRIQNRRAFDIDLEALAENDEPYALILIDVDQFKVINDTWGHQFGDYVLQRIATVLTQQLGTDFAYRIGGDEFAALTPVSEQQPLEQLLENLLIEVSNQRWREKGCKVTISMGASIGPNTPCELVNHADKALYRSKENGRDCWSMA